MGNEPAPAGKDISDQLEYVIDAAAATFVYSGMDLEESNPFS